MENSSFPPSNLCLDPLRENSSLISLKTLMQIVDSCIGPLGKLKYLQHVSGGSVTVTSSSQRLFHQLSVKNIISKFIVTASKTQLKNCNDAGLYCALLILKILHNSLQCEYPLPMIGAICDNLSELYMGCFNSEKNLCLMTVDFSDLCHLRSLVMTLLSSKPSCILTELDRNHLCSLLLKAFLAIIPSKGEILKSININVMSTDGICPMESKFFSGVLVPISVTDAKYFLNRCQTLINAIKPIKVALFTDSLSGDLRLPTGNVELCDSVSLLEITLQFLEKKVEEFISNKVDIVLCQKVIHPRLKKHLQNAGVLVLEKLGSENTKNLLCLLDDSCNMSGITNIKYGFITKVSIEDIVKNKFLLISSEDIPSFTILIGNYNEEAVTELKVVCRQIIDSLFHLLKSGKVCCGGGCLEIHTLHLLKEKLSENWDDIRNKIRCSNGLLQFAVDIFIRSVTDVCVAIQKGSRLDFATERVYGHLWKLQDNEFPSSNAFCVCGLLTASNIERSSWIHVTDFKYSDTLDTNCLFKVRTGVELPEKIILDELSCKQNALSLAFETVSMLLRTTICINNLP